MKPSQEPRPHGVETLSGEDTPIASVWAIIASSTILRRSFDRFVVRVGHRREVYR